MRSPSGVVTGMSMVMTRALLILPMKRSEMLGVPVSRALLNESIEVRRGKGSP